VKRSIDTLIIHHSASDIEAHDNIEVIEKWHIKERGFKYVGYHFYINKKGLVSIGRRVMVQGAHCKGYNKTSIGICCGGASGITPQQRESLAKLCLNLVDTFEIKRDKVFLHKDLAATECPSFDIEWLKFKLFKGRKNGREIRGKRN